MIPNNGRYKPLEFNGWKERHWTLPFQGERYSLVFFTPAESTPSKDLDQADSRERLEKEAEGLASLSQMRYRNSSNDSNVLVEVLLQQCPF